MELSRGFALDKLLEDQSMMYMDTRLGRIWGTNGEAIVILQGL